MTRDEFLSKIWLSYPPAPVAGAGERWSYGRLERFDEEQLTLSHNERTLTFTPLPTAVVGGVSQATSLVQFRLVLRPGDWLAVKSGPDDAISEVVLLAPARTSPQKMLPSPGRLRQWNEFRRRVEAFFIEKMDFLQVTTPSLVVCPGTEPHLEPFATTLKVGSRSVSRYLPTSPELSLKKMLARGYPRLFEIRSCFRNGEISPRHQPEFCMLEWYRSFASLNEIRDDLMRLLRFVTGDAGLPFRSVTIADLFAQYYAFRLTPQTKREELIDLCRKQKIHVADGDSWDDVFFRIFLEIEPRLDSAIPLVVEKYPPSQAALARLTADGWGDRFELYWRGLEIANAYHELNDPQVQRQRTDDDLRLRQNLSRTPVPPDEEFLAALDSGMPPAAGIAVGLERLFLAQNRLEDLRALRPFPED